MISFVNTSVHFVVILRIIICMIGIGDNLRRLRKQSGLSLRALGKELDISFNTLSVYERNLINPTIENCYKLSKFFEVSIEYPLLGESSTRDFKDIKLLELFNSVHALDKKEREIVKNYITRFLRTVGEFTELIKESEGRGIKKGRKKVSQDRKKDSKKPNFQNSRSIFRMTSSEPWP